MSAHGDIWPPLIGLSLGSFGYGLLLLAKGSMYGLAGIFFFIIAMGGFTLKEIRTKRDKDSYESSLPIDHPKFAMWLFLFSEVIFFSSLIGSSYGIRVHAQSWPIASQVLNVPITAFNTFVLICSSLTMALALDSVKKGDNNGLKKYLMLTILLGLTFLGIKLFEYSHLLSEGYAPAKSLFATTYFVQTGFHGLHVLGGIIAMLFLLGKAQKNHFTKENHDYVEYTGLYWHFVDIVWILLFPIIYLI
ncbi:MAG: heme-copper oxidase subunit III [Candidatus Aenigmarchaeota archaeon]|nr:heme-copper oxidase subunit III [Candidatus Aenigmarchaeota archaeon]